LGFSLRLLQSWMARCKLSLRFCFPLRETYDALKETRTIHRFEFLIGSRYLRFTLCQIPAPEPDE
jgi:hypothetical protein